MATLITEDHPRELARLLVQLAGLQDQLTELVQAKIDAMRRADMAALRTLRKKELAIAAEIQSREAVQRRLMKSLEKELDVTEHVPGALTVSEVAARLPLEQAAPLTAAAERLRRSVARLARLARDSGSANRLILNHLKWVLASVERTRRTRLAHSGDEVRLGPRAERLFEVAV